MLNYFQLALAVCVSVCVSVCHTSFIVWPQLYGPLSQFGIIGLEGKNLGLRDYTPLEIRITEISFEIGIKDLIIIHPNLDFPSAVNWDYGRKKQLS